MRRHRFYVNKTNHEFYFLEKIFNLRGSQIEIVYDITLNSTKKMFLSFELRPLSSFLH